MSRRVRHLLLLSALACAACTRGAAPRNGPDTGPQAAEGTPQADPPIADPAAEPPGRARALLGLWTLASDAPPRPSPGINLSLRVDSAAASGFSARIVHFFSGNVGIDPSRYGRGNGTLGETGWVELAIPAADPSASPLAFAGRLRGDTIPLETFALGRDTLSAYGQWYLVRAASPSPAPRPPPDGEEAEGAGDEVYGSQERRMRQRLTSSAAPASRNT